jgi:T5SS/PEP-CTERM-associated repeat protein
MRFLNVIHALLCAPVLLSPSLFATYTNSGPGTVFSFSGPQGTSLIVGGSADTTVTATPGTSTTTVNLTLGNYTSTNLGTAGHLVISGANTIWTVDGDGPTEGNNDWIFTSIKGTGSVPVPIGSTISVQNGGRLNAKIDLAYDIGGDGLLTVSGAGSLATGTNLVIGERGTATVNVDNGGKLTYANLNMAQSSTAYGTLNVTNGSSVDAVQLHVGSVGGSAMNVLGGSIVRSSQLLVGAFGTNQYSVLTISGAGTQVIVDPANFPAYPTQPFYGKLMVGYQAYGNVILKDNASLKASGEIVLGVETGGAGSLFVGGYFEVATAGLVDTPVIRGGTGMGAVIFAHDSADYELRQSSGDFIALTGNLSVNVDGGVTTIGGSTNTYSGGTYLGANFIDVGSLYVNNTSGSGTGYGEIMAFSGTLGGAGRIAPLYNNAVTFYGGALAPGDIGQLGTLQFDGASNSAENFLTLFSGTVLDYQLGAALQSDLIQVLNIQANDILLEDNVFNFEDLTGGTLSDGVYTLITAPFRAAYAGLTWDANDIITDGLFIGTGLEAYGTKSLRMMGNNVVLVIGANPVPEPGTGGLLLLALGAGLAFRPRRRV